MSRHYYIVFADFETTPGKMPEVSIWGFKIYKVFKEKNKWIYNPVEPYFKKRSDREGQFRNQWSYCYDEKNKFYWSNNFNDFLKCLKQFERKLVIYFHNFRNYDSYFLLPQLCREGYEHIELRYDKNNIKLVGEKLFLRVSKKKKIEYFKRFRIMTDKNKKVYQLKLYPFEKLYSSKKSRLPICFNFRCTLNLWPYTSVSQMGSILSEELNIKFNKGEFDYSKITKYENKKDVPNSLIKYLLRDIEIVAKFMEKWNETIGFNRTKLTIGSTAYNYWKSIFFKNKIIKEKSNLSYFLKKENFYLLKKKDKWVPRTSKKLGDEVFKKVFPTKWISKIKDIDLMFRGGITYANPKYVGLMLNNITGFDVNSMYPSMMLSKEFPYGEPLTDKKNNIDYKFKIWKIDIKNVTNLTGLPFIQKSKEKEKVVKITTLDELLLEKTEKIVVTDLTSLYPQNLKNQTVYLTGDELIRFKKYYKGSYTSSIYLQFKTISGKDLFKEYIDKWYKIKKETKFLSWKLIAKLMLNALYGKFGTKFARKSWYYHNTIWYSETIESLPTHYLPIAVAVTAYARCFLIDTIGDNVENLVYVDTDSAWIFDKKLTNFHFQESKKLGDWKKEKENVDFCVRRAKQYIYLKSEKLLHLKFAGLKYDKKEMKLIGNNNQVIDLNNKTHLKKFIFDFVNGFTHYENKTRMNIYGKYFTEELKEVSHILDKKYTYTDETWFKGMSKEHFNKIYQEKCDYINNLKNGNKI